MATLVLYHANCYDGFGAAYAAWKALGDEATYHAMYYDQPLPEIKAGDKVFILDYSRKRDELVQMVASGAMVEIHDHHKSAVQEVGAAESTLHELYGIGFTQAVMNVGKSGAVLAWERFHPHKQIPIILKHIQDRDLWLFQIEGTKEVHAYLCSKPFDFKVWDEFISEIEHYDDYVYASTYALIKDRGATILEYHDRLVDQFCEQAYLTNIGGYIVPFCNISLLFSEVPHKLLELYPDAPFAAYGYHRKDGVQQFGLRGRGDFDVSAVAKQFGGGGHHNAAGFEIKTA